MASTRNTALPVVPLPARTSPGPVAVPASTPVSPSTPKELLMDHTLFDLKNMCRAEQVKGYSNKKKEDVVDILLAHRNGTPIVQDSPKKNGLTVPQLRAAIKNAGGKNYSQLKKAELQAMLAGLLATQANPAPAQAQTQA